TTSRVLCSFFSSRRRHTRSKRDWSSDVCSSDLRLSAAAGSGECRGEESVFVLQRLGALAAQVGGDRLGADFMQGHQIGGAQQLRSEERRVGEEWCSQSGP